jgi:hypothetical protein
MKYFVITIQKLKDGTTAQNIIKYDTLNQAESAFHTEMASACVSETLESDTCIVIDEFGQTYFQRNVSAE